MRQSAHRAVKHLSAALDPVLRRPGLTVLIYHRVGGPGGSVDLAPERFRDQMAELATANVRRLDDALDDLAKPQRPEPAVAVTFDDGTADFVGTALPILVEHQIPALLYLATSFVEQGVDFPGGGPAVSWQGLRDALATGLVDIGSHTHSHVLLDRLTPEEVPDELDRCDRLIEDRLGVTPRHFAYPKAVLGSPDAQREVRARYRSAAVAGTRANRWGATDLHRLSRSPVQVADEMRWFRRKAIGGMRVEDDLRRIANRVRYAGAST